MTALNRWLEQATRHLSRDSAAQVRAEIQEHYLSEREAAAERGTGAEEAERLALAALGNAKAANREYRKVLLTTAEARMLRNGNREARAVCSNSWLKWVLLGMPIAALLAATGFFLNGAASVARVLLLAGAAFGLFFAAPVLLPIYTPLRGRVYRVVKWMAMIGAVGVAFGPDARTFAWLLASCLWIPVWTEWTRFSIRRKLPVGQWPKQLYL